MEWDQTASYPWDVAIADQSNGLLSIFTDNLQTTGWWIAGLLVLGYASWQLLKDEYAFDEHEQTAQIFRLSKPGAVLGPGSFRRAFFLYFSVLTIFYSAVSLLGATAVSVLKNAGIQPGYLTEIPIASIGQPAWPLAVSLGLIGVSRMKILNVVERICRKFAHGYAGIPENIERRAREVDLVEIDAPHPLSQFVITDEVVDSAQKIVGKAASAQFERELRRIQHFKSWFLDGADAWPGATATRPLSRHLERMKVDYAELEKTINMTTLLVSRVADAPKDKRDPRELMQAMQNWQAVFGKVSELHRHFASLVAVYLERSWKLPANGNPHMFKFLKTLQEPAPIRAANMGTSQVSFLRNYSMRTTQSLLPDFLGKLVALLALVMSLTTAATTFGINPPFASYNPFETGAIQGLVMLANYGPAGFLAVAMQAYSERRAQIEPALDPKVNLWTVAIFGYLVSLVFLSIFYAAIFTALASDFSLAIRNFFQFTPFYMAYAGLGALQAVFVVLARQKPTGPLLFAQLRLPVVHCMITAAIMIATYFVLYDVIGAPDPIAAIKTNGFLIFQAILVAFAATWMSEKNSAAQKKSSSAPREVSVA